MDNYKSCPLKKRPIVFEISDDEEDCFEHQPENLSTKPEDLSQSKRIKLERGYPSVNEENFPLNLSANSVYDQLTYMNPTSWCQTKKKRSREGSSSPTSNCSLTSSDYARETSISPPISVEYTTANIYLSGTLPQVMTAETVVRKQRLERYWHLSKDHVVPSSHIPEPTACWTDNYYAAVQPEDLSFKSYIPEPALYPHFTSPDHRQPKPTKSISRYQCDACRKSYSTFAGLSKHQQFHCPVAECNQVKKVFSCKSCEKSYNSLGALKMHIRTHTLPCKCNICGKAFSRPWLLQGHIRTHTGEKPFSCQYCHRAFADRSNLRAHLQTHADVKKYICAICSKSFSRMSLLNKHLIGGCQGVMLNNNSRSNSNTLYPTEIIDGKSNVHF